MRKKKACCSDQAEQADQQEMQRFLKAYSELSPECRAMIDHDMYLLKAREAFSQNALNPTTPSTSTAQAR